MYSGVTGRTECQQKRPFGQGNRQKPRQFVRQHYIIELYSQSVHQSLSTGIFKALQTFVWF